MPIPNPKLGEKENDFISRCMDSLKKEDMPNKQKVAICYDQYKRAKKSKAFEIDLYDKKN